MAKLIWYNLSNQVGNCDFVNNINCNFSGEPLVLECQAESSDDPKISYMWTKNGRPFIVNGQDVFSESSANGNILFISPKMSDIGTYQCEAINQFGKVFSQASLLRAQQIRSQPRRLNIGK